MRPEEIGDLLGTDPESVIVAREGALEQLAAELGLDDVSELDDVRARLAELPAAAWTGQQSETAAVKAAGPESAEQEPAVDRKPAVASGEAAKPRASERKSRLPLLLALLAVAAIVLVVVLASSGGDGDTTASSSQQSSTPAQKPKPHKPKPKPAKPAAPKPGPQVALTPLGDAKGARGTASLTKGGKRLQIKASGLRAGAYQVWLYDSVIDTVSLTKVRGTKLALDLKLPRNASHYRYVDISREPADGNPNHSGASVLRAPLAKLSR
jgi:hypothetical protein